MIRHRLNTWLGTHCRAVALSTLCLQPFLVLPSVAQDAAEIMLRLDRLEAENRRLNGQVEQLGNQVRRLDDQLKRFQNDVDFRFKESGGAAKSSAPAKRSDAFDPAANPGSSGGQKTIGQLAAETAGTPMPKSGGSTAALGPSPGSPSALSPGPATTKTPTAAGSGPAKAEYDVASAMLERGEYEAAEMAFREFLRNHGKDRLKPEAVFGLGESFYRRNRYREAAEQYLSVTTDHAKSSRAAEAMLKLGMSLRGLGATPEACGTYSEVVKKYPNASPAIKQAVDREKKRAQCTA